MTSDAIIAAEDDQQELTPYARQPSALDLALAAWLDAKAKRTNSSRTLAAYSETISRYRVRLQRHGLDLDAPDERALALVAQAFADERSAAASRGKGQPVAPATYNLRLNILSSFYTFARRRRLLDSPPGNPIELVERRPDRAYQSATPLDARRVAERLSQIDRASERGARDYALLALGLSTGRRLAELVSLTWGDFEFTGSGGFVVTFHAKGGKTMRDELAPAVAEAVWQWAFLRYGAAGVAQGLPRDEAVWVSLERNSRGHPLTHQAVSDLCRKRLGTSKVHALRHTFAHGMEQVGATPAEIQRRLGHSSLQTTGRYLAALTSAQNAHAADLAALFGLK